MLKHTGRAGQTRCNVL